MVINFPFFSYISCKICLKLYAGFTYIKFNFSSRKRETYGDGTNGASGSSDDAFADALSMPEREDVRIVICLIRTVLIFLFTVKFRQSKIFLKNNLEQNIIVKMQSVLFADLDYLFNFDHFQL